MAKTVIRWIPADPYEIPKIESWLSDQAQKGLMLKRMGSVFAWFTKEEPAQVTYRIEPIVPKSAGIEPDEERKAMYREWGWEYVWDLQRMFWILRSRDLEPQELHTDTVAEGYVYKRLNQELRRTVISQIFALFVPMLWGSMELLRLYKTPLYALVRYGVEPMMFLPLVLWGVVTAILGCWRLGSIKKLQRSLERGEPFPHCQDVSVLTITPARKASMIATGICVFLEVLVWIGIALALIFDPLQQEKNPCYLPLAQVESGNQEVIQESQLGEDEASYWFSFLTRKQYTISEYATVKNNGAAKEVFMQTDYYDLVSEKLSGPFMEQNMKQEQQYFHDFSITEQSPQGFDQLVIGRWNSMQYLFARKGTQVIEITYSGEVPLNELAGQLLEKFEQAK
ncbi:MAG: DUF2812 domain-containing protein [Massiliimalia sp.]|jgi:hypothetical protein